MLTPAVFDGYDERERPGSVTRGGVQRHGSVAKRDRLLVQCHDVATRTRVARVLGNEIPVGSTHDNSRPELVLKELRPAVVVAVPMADDQILHRCRVQTELAQPFNYRVLHRVVEQRIDDDEPVRV